jgi:hypothetical protein
VDPDPEGKKKKKIKIKPTFSCKIVQIILLKDEKLFKLPVLITTSGKKQFLLLLLLLKKMLQNVCKVLDPNEAKMLDVDPD